MTKPVGPEVARAPSEADLAPWIEVANAHLIKPWSDYEIGNGRWLSVAVLGGSENARRLIPFFTKAGWTVTFEDDQREGAALRFKP